LLEIYQINHTNVRWYECKESRDAPRITTTSVFEMDADYDHRLSEYIKSLILNLPNYTG